jgi:hypothetical protein
MDIGATLTTREAKIILRRLNTITKLTEDRRIKEQARMVCCEVNKAVRRVAGSKSKNKTQNPTQ